MNLDLKKQLVQIVHDAFGVDVQPEIVIPQDLDHGDFSSNIALVLNSNAEFKTNNPEMTNPREIAEKILVKIESLNLEMLSKAEVAGPGFINFYVSQDALKNLVQSIQKEGDSFGFGNSLQGKKVMVEFTDPNPLKEFHIGHLYSNTVGESLSRLFEAQGAQVWRVCYQGDVGLHVAKAVYGIIQKLEFEKTTLEILSRSGLGDRANFLGQAYALGAKAYEEENDAKEKIIDINGKIYNKDPEFYSIYDTAKKWSLEYFDSLYDRLGTKFVRYYFESEAGSRGIMIVRQYINKLFKEDQGSVIFPKEISGLHTRVFINSQGLPTYEAKELGLAPYKYEEFPYDLSVIVTGNEINEYFKVLLKALSMIRPELAERTRHISHGMVRLPTGKMSSRTGSVITGDSLLNDVKEVILERSKEDERIDEVTADHIGVGAIKYSLLKSGLGKDVTFNIDESISIEGNSGPYLLYSYVRTLSILNKAGGIDLNKNIDGSDFEEGEERLLRVLGQFSAVVEEAGKSFSPSDVCTYLYSLAKEFNLFYEKNKIIGNERQNIRLHIIHSTGQVIKNGLNLLGIRTVEKM